MNLRFEVLRQVPIGLALVASLASPACGVPDEEEPVMTFTPVDPSAPATTPTTPSSGPGPTATPPPVNPPPPATVVDPVDTGSTAGSGGTTGAGGTTGSGGMAGSGGDDAPPARCTTAGPSYSTIADIMDANCTASCHEPMGILGGPGGFDPNAMLDLKPAAGYAQLTTMKSLQVPEMWLVGTGLEDSYLWYKLKNTQLDVGGSGVSMPFGAALTDADLALIEAWITGGACP